MWGHVRSGRKDRLTTGWMDEGQLRLLMFGSFPCISTCRLHYHSAPGNSAAATPIQTSPFHRLLECRGLFLTRPSTPSLSPHASWRQPWVALHVREPESGWLVLAKWRVGYPWLRLRQNAKTIFGGLLETFGHFWGRVFRWPDPQQRRVKEGSESESTPLWSKPNCCCLATHQWIAEPL